jgi:uncharacterized OsmC-like protein
MIEWQQAARARGDLVDATTLRSRQAPLKDRYRQDPASAVTPLHASGAWVAEGITCTVDGWSGPVRAGLHLATGGGGGDACSGDMLLQALVACAGVTMRSVATALGVEVRNASISAVASFDARGTLGISREVDVGISPVTLHVQLETDADDATLERLAALTERYCVVGQSLREPAKVEIRRGES